MPYRKTYNKKRPYRRRRYGRKKTSSMYTIAKRVLNQQTETRRFLPLDDNTGNDGYQPTSASRFTQRELEWVLDSGTGDSIGYIKPFVLQAPTLSINSVNKDGDHTIQGKSIQPKYLSIKCHLKNRATTTSNDYGPVRICVLRLRNNTDKLPDPNVSPTETGNGGLFTRIDTDKYWVIKDTIINLIPQASGVPREMNWKYFKKMSGKLTYEQKSTGDLDEDNVSYPTGGIFVWFFYNRPGTSVAPVVNSTYTVGFKDN